MLRTSTLTDRRFVTAKETLTEVAPFTLNAWMSRPDIVPCKELLMVRATMEPGRCHPFHYHPTREEIIYIVSGQAEQRKRVANLAPRRNGLDSQGRGAWNL